MTYKKVFDRYNKSFSDRLAESSFELYKKTRLRFADHFPLSENERYIFRSDSDFERESSKMPKGYNYISHSEEEGYLKLEYIDFFDYLPKEELSDFLSQLKKFVAANKMNPFGKTCSRDDLEKVENLGRFLDGNAFSHLLSVVFQKNDYLQKHCRGLAISLRNLSTTFLIVKYRVYLNEEFNSVIQNICNNKYNGYSRVYRKFDVPWFAVKKFGRSYYTGDNRRQEELYRFITQLKWKTVKEIRKKINIHFLNDRIFPPTFETYSTNIRPEKDGTNDDFWRSVLLDSRIDYAPRYNACVCWGYKRSRNEGNRLAAYCGGDYSNSDFLQDIAKHDLSDTFAEYLTATSIDYVANRDIENFNKKISKVIRKNNTGSLLKLRVKVERKMYYSYRFLSEFSGKSISIDDGKTFRHPRLKNSYTILNLKSVAKWTAESKKQIDNVLKLLNDAAEYKSSQSNSKAQWVMLIVTILSLVIAVLSVNNSTINSIVTCVWNWISNLFTQIFHVAN